MVLEVSDKSGWPVLRGAVMYYEAIKSLARADPELSI